MPTDVSTLMRDNAESVRREAAPYRGMSVDEKLRLVASACRTAMLLLSASPNRQRALAYADPLPQSSIDALARLRRSRTRTLRSA